jgi:hypothetical protein
MKIAFKNYMYYQGDPTTNSKNNTIKLAESTQCLDKIIYTYYDNTARAAQAQRPPATAQRQQSTTCSQGMA